MAPKFVISRRDFEGINLYLAKEVLLKLNEMKDMKNLPNNIKMIGIATNNMLGVFNLIKNDYGYICYRMCLDKNGDLVVSDSGYQVTNIGNGTAPLECNMDYIISTSQLKIL